MGNTVIAPISGSRAGNTDVVVQHAATQFAVVNVTMSNSYAAGGDACDLTASGGILGRAQPVAVWVQPNSGYIGVYDITNKKMLVYRQSAATSALTEATGVNLSAVVFTCLVLHY